MSQWSSFVCDETEFVSQLIKTHNAPTQPLKNSFALENKYILKMVEWKTNKKNVISVEKIVLCSLCTLVYTPIQQVAP